MYPKYIQKYSVHIMQQLMLVAINYFDIYAFNSCLLHQFSFLFVPANITCLVYPTLETGCNI